MLVVGMAFVGTMVRKAEVTEFIGNLRKDLMGLTEFEVTAMR
jgi:hypothetical protein